MNTARPMTSADFLDAALFKLRWLERAPAGGRCDLTPAEGAAILSRIAELERELDTRIDAGSDRCAVCGLKPESSVHHDRRGQSFHPWREAVSAVDDPPDSTRSSHAHFPLVVSGPKAAVGFTFAEWHERKFPDAAVHHAECPYPVCREMYRAEGGWA